MGETVSFMFFVMLLTPDVGSVCRRQLNIREASASSGSSLSTEHDSQTVLPSLGVVPCAQDL